MQATSISSNISLGFAQILLWGGSFFILSILATPIMEETKWTQPMVYGALSFALAIAGLISPCLGRLIQYKFGERIMLYAGVPMGLGLAIVGLSVNYLMFLAGWFILGIAMGMGLYDALFATLGWKYGKSIGKSIVYITLISGFAPTVSWFLVSRSLTFFDWRTTCLIYAFVLVGLVYVLHKFAFKLSLAGNGQQKAELDSAISKSSRPVGASVYYMLLANFTIGSVLMTGISLHLIDILLNKSFSFKVAIGMASILGPSQVVVRMIDLSFPKLGPQKTAVLSGVAIVVGLMLLQAQGNWIYVGILVFGMGNGMRSILRATLPMAIYGQTDYASIVGRLARMPLIAQAATPFSAAYFLSSFGSSNFVYILIILALVNLLLALIIKKQTINIEMEKSELLLDCLIAELNQRADVAELRIEDLQGKGLNEGQCKFLLSYFPENVLIIYGTLAPGKPNHHKVSHIRGEWKPAVIKGGKLDKKGWGAEMGFDGFTPCQAADQKDIDAMILYAGELKDNYAVLDEFEGVGYQRILARFELENGKSGVGYIYAVR